MNKLVANLNRKEMTQVVKAALGGKIALVPLAAPPNVPGMHQIELHVAGWSEPLVLEGEPAGFPVAGKFPLRMRAPADQREELIALLEAEASMPSSRQLVPADAWRPVGLVESLFSSGEGAPPPPAPPQIPSSRLAGSASLVSSNREAKAKAPTPRNVAPLPEPVPEIAGLVPQEPQSIRVAPHPSQPIAYAPAPAAPPPITPQPGPAAPVAVATPTSIPLPGRIIASKYRIDALKGTGGMGNIYRGLHLTLERPIAIKILHAEFQRDPEAVAAFHREALAASRLDHTNVVRVFDFGQEPDGLLYLIMELIDGDDLREVIDREERLALPRCVDIMAQVATALAASHEQSVIHRDIKPENVLLLSSKDEHGNPRDLVKVCDFGIAEMLERRSAADGSVVGTPNYVSPEQARAETVDARTDIYSSGVILYELVTGRVPFQHDDPLEVLSMHMRATPTPPTSLHPQCSAKLEGIILRAMAKEPSRRFQTARDLRNELAGAMSTATAVDAPRLRGVDHADEDAGLGIPAVGRPLVTRHDAIDIADIVGSSDVGDRPMLTREEQFLRAQDVAAAISRDALGYWRSLNSKKDDTRAFGEEMEALVGAAEALAQRGDGTAVLDICARLTAFSRGTSPSVQSSLGLAARAVQQLGRPEPLAHISEIAIDGHPVHREPARKVLLLMGQAGARALLLARERRSGELGAQVLPPQGGAWHWRTAFVNTLREIGPSATPLVIASLARVNRADAAHVETLLLALPPSRDDRAGNAALQFVRHEAPSVRHAAIVALANTLEGRGADHLVAAIADTDDAPRMAAIAALRKSHLVDHRAIVALGRILDGTQPGGPRLLELAASALADTPPNLRVAAGQMLVKLLRPAGGGLLSMIGRKEEGPPGPVLIAAAQAALAIGEPAAAEAIAARASRSPPDVRRTLEDLLARRA